MCDSPGVVKLAITHVELSEGFFGLTIPMYAGLRVISTYVHENRFKSRLWKIMHVLRDDLGNIKGTKMVHGV